MTRSERRFGSALALTCLTCALLLGSVSRGGAERERPPPAYTGGFSEPLCTECHLTADVNDGDGTLSVEGLPRWYEPGGTYLLTITLTQEYLTAAGFQMAVRLEAGRHAGRQAGSLAAAPADTGRVDVTTAGAVQYVHHVYAGTMPVAPDTARWHVVWTAPDSGTVVFHLAANAADDDDSPMGDMIYATSLHTASR
ncbi:MAG TPA: choice-of-anchor V domain-containing protein [Longimicrobiales bacterium]|nr:choice-of-anchor V domain-containing protein [Longimicrobiales bacterium]